MIGGSQEKTCFMLVNWTHAITFLDPPHPSKGDDEAEDFLSYRKLQEYRSYRIRLIESFMLFCSGNKVWFINFDPRAWEIICAET